MPDGRVVLLDAGSTSLADPVRKCIARSCAAAGARRSTRSGSATATTTTSAPRRRSSARTACREVVIEHRVRRPRRREPGRRAAARQRSASATRRDAQLPPRRALDVAQGRHARRPLAAGRSAALDSNNSGLVLKLTYARRTILFPADIQQPALAELLKSPDELRCDVLHRPAPRQRRVDAPPRFIAAADPLYIVSSNDRTLSQKQRLFEQLSSASGRSFARTAAARSRSRSTATAA